MLSAHCTKEERSQYKYYCSECDLIFISKLYHDKHKSGKIHNNRIKASKSVIEENIKYIKSDIMKNKLDLVDKLIDEIKYEI